MRKPKKKFSTLKETRRVRKKLSIRKKIIGTESCPRVCAIKTNKNLSLIAVDDSKGTTIACLGTFGKNKVEGSGKSVEGAKALGVAFASSLKDKGIETIVYDRNGFPYHGLVKSLAEGMRESGIKF